MRKLLAAMTFVTVALSSGIFALTAQAAQARPATFQNSGYFSGDDYSGTEAEYGYWSRNYAGSICVDLDFMELCYREDVPYYNNRYPNDERMPPKPRNCELLLLTFHRLTSMQLIRTPCALRNFRPAMTIPNHLLLYHL